MREKSWISPISLLTRVGNFHYKGAIEAAQKAPQMATETSLTHETGAFNRSAISAEVDRRLAVMVETWAAKGYDAKWIASQRASYFVTVTEWVEREARIERHDIFERTMANLTTAVERARITQLMHLGNCQPISGDGNIAARDFFGEADIITRAIRARTEAHFSIIEQASLSSDVRAAAKARAAVSAN